MHVTEARNDVIALNAGSGRRFRVYRYTPSADRTCCRGFVNRELGILDDTLYMATLDANPVAVDAKNG